MNRFTKQSLSKRIFESVNFSVLFFVAVMLVFIVGISFISSKNDKDGREILEAALNKDIVHCYAIEGYYPPNLDYIEEHYGLTYDHTKYLVDYEPIGNNIMPNVTIVEKVNR